MAIRDYSVLLLPGVREIANEYQIEVYVVNPQQDFVFKHRLFGNTEVFKYSEYIRLVEDNKYNEFNRRVHEICYKIQPITKMPKISEAELENKIRYEIMQVEARGYNRGIQEQRLHEETKIKTEDTVKIIKHAIMRFINKE